MAGRNAIARFSVQADGVDQAKRELEGLTRQVDRLGETKVDGVRHELEQLGTSAGKAAEGYQSLTDEQRRNYQQREQDAQQVERLKRSYKTLEGALEALDVQVQYGHRSAEEAARLQPQLAAAYTRTGTAARQAAADLQAGTAATKAAAAAQDTAHQSASRLRGVYQNLGYQVADVANQVSTGGNIWSALGMQLGQFLGVFGAVGAIAGAVVSIMGAVAASVASAGKSADESGTAYTNLARAMDLAAKASGEMRTASGANRAALEAERRSVIAAREEIVRKAEAELLAIQASAEATHNSADTGAPEMGMAAGAYEEAATAQKKRISELRRELALLQGEYGVFNDGAREVTSSTGKAGEATKGYQEQIVKLRENLRGQIEELGVQVETFDKSSAAKLRAKLQTEAMTAAGVADYKAVDAGTKALIDQAVARQEQIDRLEEQKKATEEAEQQSEQARAEHDRAVVTAQDMVDRLKDEADQLGMTDRERAIFTRTMEAERQLRGKLSAGEMAEYLYQIKQEAGALYDATEARDKKKKADEEAVRALEKYQQDVTRVATDIGKDISENLWDQITGQAKADGALTFFKNWAKRLGVELLNQNIVLPITAQIVGAVPGLFGLSAPAGAAGKAGAAGQGGMGQLGNLFSLGSKFIPSSWTDGITSGITSTIDQWGYSAFGIGGPASVMPSTVTMGANGMLAGGGAQSVVVGQTAAGTAGLTSYLGPIGAGFAAGSLFGPMLANGNKAVGGLTGAASGAAAGALVGSIIPGIGTLIGALIGGASGGLGGLLGTQKPTVGPNSAGNIVLNGKGGFRTDKALADNDGDAGAMQQVTDAVATAMSTLVSGLGAKLTGSDGANTGLLQFFGKDNKWYVTPQTGAQAGQRSEFTDQDQALQFYMRSTLQGLLSSGQLTGLNADAKKALTTSKATKAEDLAADLEFATGFRDQLALFNANLDPTNNLIKTFTENTKKVGEQVKTNITDWAAKAKELGLATEEELTPALKKGLLAMMGLGPWTEPLRGLAAVTKQATIGFEAFRPALVSLGYTAEDQAYLLSEYVAKAEKTYTDSVSRLQRGGSATLDALTDPFAKTPVLDRLVDSGLDPRDGYVTGLATVIGDVERTARTGTLAMTDLRWALGQVDAQLMAGVLTAEQYQTVVGMLTQAWSDNATAVQRTTERAQAGEDLTVRSLRGQGLVTDADNLERGLRHQREIAEAVSKGYDSAYIAGLKYVQYLENAAVANERAAKQQERAADLASRAATLVGNSVAAATLKLDLQQAKERRQAVADGWSIDELAQLSIVQSGERAEGIFQAALQAYTGEIDRQVAAINDNTKTARDQIAANQQFVRSVQDAARDRLLSDELSPLSTLERLVEARKQVDDTYALALTGDETARGRIVELIDSQSRIARDYYETTDTSDFWDGQDKLEQLGITAGAQLDTDEQAVKIADAQLKELQAARADAMRQAERSSGDLVSLKATMDGARSDWLTALKGIETALGKTGTGSNQAALQAGWMTDWFGRYNRLVSDMEAGRVSADQAQFLGTELWQEKVTRANALPLDPAVWTAVIGAAAAAPNGTGTAAWLRQVAHDRGVPTFAAGGIVPFIPGLSVAGTDSTPLIGMPGEGVVNLRGMGLLGPDGLAALNAGRWPANDRSGRAALRSVEAPGSSPDTGALLAELRRQNALLARLIAVTEDGDAENSAATRETAAELRRALGDRVMRTAEPVGLRRKVA